MIANNTHDIKPYRKILKKLKGIYRRQSSKASDNARTIAFGAAAICWFFKTKDVQFPSLIIMSMISLSAYFVCDLLQYYTSAVSYYGFYRNVRDGKLSEPDIKNIADNVDKKSGAYFHIKFGFLIISYLFIGLELGNRWLTTL